jgi:hypothetical protein
MASGQRITECIEELKALDDKGDYLGVIVGMKNLIAEDSRVFTNDYVKQWCGRRWRKLFLQEAVKDSAALKEAKKFLGGDKRPPAQKISERFLKNDHPGEWQVDMPEAQISKLENTTLVFCPGLLNGLLPERAFYHELPTIEQEYDAMGWRIMRADAHPMRGCDANNADLLSAVNEGRGFEADPGRGTKENKRNGPPPKDVVLMGYSKGAPDILSLLVNHPELKDRVRCVFTWAGAVGGSYMADSLYELFKDLPTEAVIERLHDFLALVSAGSVQKGSLRRLDEYDIKDALRELSTHTRSAFNKQHKEMLDAMNIPFFTITAATTLLEVPTFQMADYLNLSKYDGNNDMQLTQNQAKLDLPMATHIAMLHGHHWDISYPPYPRAVRMTSPNLDHPFPRKAAAVAIFKFAAELGLMD